MIHAVRIRAGIRGEGVFDAVKTVLDMLSIAARERWAHLAPEWQPDTSGHNGTAWICPVKAVWAVRNAATFEKAMVNAVNLGRLA